jgi:hypothetical protein
MGKVGSKSGLLAGKAEFEQGPGKMDQERRVIQAERRGLAWSKSHGHWDFGKPWRRGPPPSAFLIAAAGGPEIANDVFAGRAAL